jgi:hypothetical protein
MLHRNKGAPFRRDDGSIWAKGMVAEPTDNELRRRKHKLKPEVIDNRPPPPPAPIPAPPTPPPVEEAPAEEEEEEVVPTEWTLAMKPALYLRLHPNGPHAELAQKLVNEQDEEEEPDAEDG